MKKQIKSIVSIFAFMSLVGCTDNFENINDNPNNPVEVPTYGIFNYASKEVVGVNQRGSFGSARLILPWVQYSAQRNYTEEDRFQFRVSTNNSIFNSYYRQAKNFKDIIDLNTNPETAVTAALYGNTDNQIASSRIMLAYIFSNLVDMFGDVPYYSYGNQDADFQALDLGNLTPKFASQEKIYTDLLEELKQASEQIDMNEGIFFNNQGDNLFQSPEKLKRFANSLRLRIANRVKNVIPTANAHIQDAIASGVMLSNSDTVGLQYENNSVNPAPTYEAFFIDNRTDYTISKTFVDVMKGETSIYPVDPRLQIFAAPVGVSKANSLSNAYEPTEDLTKYQGMPYGIASGQTATQRARASLYGNAIFRADYTEILMEYAEVEFLLAEVNGWNQTNYENGVRASMERWGVDSAKIDTFIADLPAASEETVITQKYMALFMQPYEAWAEYRRTGFPNFLIQPGGTGTAITPISGSLTYTFTPLEDLTEMPTRVPYPLNQATLTPIQYNEAVQHMGPDTMDTKLIWDLN